MSLNPLMHLRTPEGRRAALMIGLIAAAFLVPRLLALQGLSHTWHFDFGDGPIHLEGVDKLAKLGALPQEEVERLARLGVELEKGPNHPDGVYRVAAVFSRHLGPLSIWTTQLTNGLFTLVLLLGVVGLGHAAGGLRLGLWAALLTVLCPALVGASWYFSLDYPLVAMTTFGAFLLVRTRRLTRRWACLAFALWSALGFCVKFSYAIFILPMGVAALAAGLWRPGARLRVLVHGLLVAALTQGLSMYLQGISPGQYMEVLMFHAMPDMLPNVHIVEPFSWQWFVAVPAFTAGMFPSPLIVLALPGVYLLHRRRPPAWRVLTLAMLWGSCALLTLMSHKLARYALPMCPVLCLLTAWWLIKLVPRRLQTGALAATALAYCAVLAVAHAYPPPWLWENRFDDMRIPSSHALAQLRENRVHPQCKMQPLLGAVAELSERQGPHGVFWICPMWDETFDPPRPPPYVNVATLASQVVRDRVVEDVVNLTKNTRVPPALVVVHPASMEPTRVAPCLRLQERRSVTLTCGETAFPVHLSSYRCPSSGKQ